MLKPIIRFAKRIRDFPRFAALIIIVLLALGYRFFSKGAFDPIVQYLDRLNSNQVFVLTVICVLAGLALLALCIVLVYRWRPSDDACRISVVVHKADDFTEGIEGASVALSTTLEPQKKITDDKGNVVFFVHSTLRGTNCKLNAKKKGFLERDPIDFSLENKSHHYLPLSARQMTPEPESDIKQEQFHVADGETDISNSTRQRGGPTRTIDLNAVPLQKCKSYLIKEFSTNHEVISFILKHLGTSPTIPGKLQESWRIFIEEASSEELLRILDKIKRTFGDSGQLATIRTCKEEITLLLH